MESVGAPPREGAAAVRLGPPGMDGERVPAFREGPSSGREPVRVVRNRSALLGR
jgi:hypothetical protein